MVSSTYAAILRRREEAEMTDSCVIVERVATSRDPDPGTGTRETTPRAVYTGRCQYVSGGTQARDADSAGRALVQQGAVLKLPVDAPGSADVTAGHIATVTLGSHDSTAEPFDVRVQTFHHQTFAVARRLPVEEFRDG